MSVFILRRVGLTPIDFFISRRGQTRYEWRSGFGKHGQITGIVIGKTASKDTVVLRASFIASELKKKFGEIYYKDNLTCNNHFAL